MAHIEIPYRPRKHQLLIHNSLKRFNVLVCHRRMGKTVCTINEIIKQALTCTKKNPRFAYIAPTYKQAKGIAWDYVKEYTRSCPQVKWNETELRCDLFNGARIQLHGADKTDSLKGLYFDGVVFDEVAQMKSSIWTETIRPTLVDRKGKAIFIGTPKGHNFFYNLFQKAEPNDDWYSVIYKASETGVIPQDELDAARLVMSEEEYNQEFECSFEAAIVGSYYGKLMAQAERDGRICNVPYDPRLPVNTYWDLGVHDSTSIWFVQTLRSGEIRVIDYLENSGEGLQFYINELREKPYVYDPEGHFAPHDIQVREFSSGVSRYDTAAQLGIRFNIIQSKPGAVQEGINATRMILPRCWFDQTNCERGIEALKQYKKVWDEKNGVFKPKPLHDWTSHAADAFRGFAISHRDIINEEEYNYSFEEDRHDDRNDITGY